MKKNEYFNYNRGTTSFKNLVLNKFRELEYEKKKILNNESLDAQDLSIRLDAADFKFDIMLSKMGANRKTVAKLLREEEIIQVGELVKKENIDFDLVDQFIHGKGNYNKIKKVDNFKHHVKVIEEIKEINKCEKSPDEKCKFHQFRMQILRNYAKNAEDIYSGEGKKNELVNFEESFERADGLLKDSPELRKELETIASKKPGIERDKKYREEFGKLHKVSQLINEEGRYAEGPREKFLKEGFSPTILLSLNESLGLEAINNEVAKYMKIKDSINNYGKDAVLRASKNYLHNQFCRIYSENKKVYLCIPDSFKSLLGIDVDVNHPGVDDVAQPDMKIKPSTAKLDDIMIKKAVIGEQKKEDPPSRSN
jgi:hypothetical protein